MWKDEIVEEVREARRQYAAEHGNDLRRIYQDLKRFESGSGRQILAPPAKLPRDSKSGE